MLAWPHLAFVHRRSIFNLWNRRVAEEDRHILESTSRSEVPEAREAHSVRTDAPTLRFRKDYLKRLKGSLSVPTTSPPFSSRVI